MPDKVRKKTYHHDTPLVHKFIDAGEGTYAELIYAKLINDVDHIIDLEIREVGYRISDVDDDATPNYFGYLDASGEWYILKEVVSPGANTYRYAKGDADYTIAWTGRVALDYDYYDEEFG